MLLPTYDVFDEARYFVPADHQSSSQTSKDVRPHSPSARTPGTTNSSGITASISATRLRNWRAGGAKVLLSINASP